MFFDWGNPPIHSTLAATVSNPSTATLVDELDSTLLGTVDLAAGQRLNCQAIWIAGADTIATFVLEHTISTGLGSTAVTTTIMVRTPTNQSGQWVSYHRLGPNDRLRMRVNSTFTGNVFAHVSAQIMT